MESWLRNYEEFVYQRRKNNRKLYEELQNEFLTNLEYQEIMEQFNMGENKAENDDNAFFETCHSILMDFRRKHVDVQNQFLIKTGGDY